MVAGNSQKTMGRIMAIDFGRVHTGIAVSDPTGTVVRPLKDVKQAMTHDGMKEIAAVVDREKVLMVLVGMPVSLNGSHGEQAVETALFVNELIKILEVPVKTWDERFTSKIAREKGMGAAASEHSIAACCLLEDYLDSEAYRR